MVSAFGCQIGPLQHACPLPIMSSSRKRKVHGQNITIKFSMTKLKKWLWYQNWLRCWFPWVSALLNWPCGQGGSYLGTRCDNQTLGKRFSAFQAIIFFSAFQLSPSTYWTKCWPLTPVSVLQPKRLWAVPGWRTWTSRTCQCQSEFDFSHHRIALLHLRLLSFYLIFYTSAMFLIPLQLA